MFATLKETRTGVHIEARFSEEEYRPVYAKLLRNINHMSKEYPHRYARVLDFCRRVERVGRYGPKSLNKHKINKCLRKRISASVMPIPEDDIFIRAPSDKEGFED